MFKIANTDDRLNVFFLMKIFPSFLIINEFAEYIFDAYHVDLKFTYTDDDFDTVVNNIFKDCAINIKKMRVPWYKRRFTKVRAYTLKGNHKDIYLNEDKVSLLKNHELAALLLHEICHLAGYQHGSNTPHGYKYYNSVPEKMESMLLEWYANEG